MGRKQNDAKWRDAKKQAQGTHDGMCKRHWKATNLPAEATKKENTPPEPEGDSVYDSIIPMSIAYRPLLQKPDDQSFGSKHDGFDPPCPPADFQVMPLVSFLKEGIDSGKPPGWHRNSERRARGMFPVKGLSVQLEPWERQLALVEILLLSGGTPYANFKDLAYAWGREKGFHHVLANSVCERRGEVERKKRSDAGKSMTEEERLAFRTKLQKARDKNGTSKKSKKEATEPETANSKDDPQAEDGIPGAAVASLVYMEAPKGASIPHSHHHEGDHQCESTIAPAVPTGGMYAAGHMVGHSGEVVPADSAAHVEAEAAVAMLAAIGTSAAEPMQEAPNASTVGGNTTYVQNPLPTEHGKGQQAEGGANYDYTSDPSSTNDQQHESQHQQQQDAESMAEAGMAVDVVLV